MARTARYILAISILAVVFMVLAENFSVKYLFYAVLVSIFALGFTRWLLPSANISILKRINFFRLVVYIPCLIFYMIEAAVKSFAFIAKRASTETYEYPTVLTDEFNINLLANSITLTPGTVCVEHRGDRLLVMQLVLPGKNTDPARIKQMEKLISKI